MKNLFGFLCGSEYMKRCTVNLGSMVPNQASKYFQVETGNIT